MRGVAGDSGRREGRAEDEGSQERCVTETALATGRVVAGRGLLRRWRGAAGEEKDGADLFDRGHWVVLPILFACAPKTDRWTFPYMPLVYEDRIYGGEEIEADSTDVWDLWREVACPHWPRCRGRGCRPVLGEGKGTK
jgi:hypothetical protein